jgi:sensor histidine kinase YesM
MMKMIEKEKNIRIPKTVIGVAFIAVIAVIAVVVATIGTVYSVAISVCSILLIVVISIAVIWWETKKNVQGVLESQRIEAEKQAIEMKLQESQIAIMLSQIQPHFLYNTLNSIYQLCETNPMRARSMVNFFAEYLRNNLSTLEEPGLISFETELSHIKTYLEIEKIRFEDTLEIEYDIKCADFSLPVLTVQPIVENAVKHGTSKKRGGGVVTIATNEGEESYIIKVTDTGCGFDPNQPKDDGKRHIGIENVRQRLFSMCGGTLTIESELGKGTLATIIIPKGWKQ